MLGGQLLELRHELDMTTGLEVGVDSPLERNETELFETGGLVLRERLVREVGERRTTPEGERLPQSFGIAALDEGLEALEIELALLDPDHVPGRPRFDSIRAQQLP